MEQKLSFLKKGYIKYLLENKMVVNMAYLSSDPSAKERCVDANSGVLVLRSCGILDLTFIYAVRWIMVYPAYLNAKRTVAEGRRVPKEKVEKFESNFLR